MTCVAAEPVTRTCTSCGRQFDTLGNGDVCPACRWRKRRRAIVLLLSSRNDARFEPEGADARRMRLAAVRGEVASKRVRCPNGCDGGWKVDRFRRRPCERCGGRMFEHREPGVVAIVETPGRGWIEVDPYTERETGSERTGVTVARTRMVMCDRCGGTRFYGGKRCLLCRGSGSREVAAEPLRAAHTSGESRKKERVYNDPLLVAEERWRERGSYQALDVALDTLHRVWPWGRMLVHRVFEVGELSEAELGGATRRRLEAALKMLDTKMCPNGHGPYRVGALCRECGAKLDHLLPRRLRVPRAVIEAAERRGRC